MSEIRDDRAAAKALHKARDLMARARRNEGAASRRAVPNCASAEKERERAYRYMEEADALFDAVTEYLDHAEDEEALPEYADA